MKVLRLRRNVVSLKSVVDSLRKERLVSEPCEEMLENYTEKITGNKVRKQLSKLVLFKHQ